MERHHYDEFEDYPEGRLSKFGRWLKFRLKPNQAPEESFEVLCQNCGQMEELPIYDFYLYEQPDKSYDMHFNCLESIDQEPRPILTSVNIPPETAERVLQAGGRLVPLNPNELMAIDPQVRQIEIDNKLRPDHHAPISGSMYDKIWNIKP